MRCGCSGGEEELPRPSSGGEVELECGCSGMRCGWSGGVKWEWSGSEVDVQWGVKWK